MWMRCLGDSSHRYLEPVSFNQARAFVRFDGNYWTVIVFQLSASIALKSARIRMLGLTHSRLPSAAASPAFTKPMILPLLILSSPNSAPIFRPAGRITWPRATSIWQISLSRTAKSLLSWTGRWPATTRGGPKIGFPSVLSGPETSFLTLYGPC